MPDGVDRLDVMFPPPPAEVRAVAEKLGVGPEQLQSIRLPGPGRRGETILSLGAPEIEGFGRPPPTWLDTGEPTPRLTSVYRSDDGVFIVVSHEHGPEIYMLVDVAATSVIGAVVGEAVRRFLDWALHRRGEPHTPGGVARARRRAYDANGNVISDEEVEISFSDLR